jgi:hypothetical protein
MSCTKCNRPIKKGENTKVNNNECTFKMQDGRMFTDYRPRCTIQYQMKNEKMQNSYDSRLFLINNAEKLMKMNDDIVNDKVNCNRCFDIKEDGTMLQEKNLVKCNKKTCDFTEQNDNGIGTGRIYN